MIIENILSQCILVIHIKGVGHDFDIWAIENLRGRGGQFQYS
jgi:hypothetical protein